MIMRRGILKGLVAMTIPGLGGQTPQRPDQAYAGQQGAQVAPGSTNVVRARQVIVSGPGEGVYTYSPSVGAGNLISTAGIATAGTDPFGNQYLAGNSSYGSGIASSVTAGGITFYTGSLAGGWTSLATVSYNAGLSELYFSAGQAEFNAALVHADGVLQVDGFLNVNGTQINAPNATAINFDVATIDLKNGNLNLNMARPPNYAAVVAGTATAAQVEACLGGLLTSLTNRQLMA
jgi:hypothetical protein